MPTAVVIIPTYNERENIDKLIPVLADVFAPITTYKMKVLVVDDTSPDGTAEVVKQLQKKYSFLELFINHTKAGLGAAYLKGMAHAFGELKADVVFEFDADFSHDPSKIPLFLKAIDDGADMVLGSRYIKGGSIPANWGLHRKFLSVVGNLFIMGLMTNFRIRDWTGGYRALTKEVYEAVRPHLTSQRFSGYTFQIGFLYNAVKQNFKIVEVPFHFVDRTVGLSKMGPEYIKNILIYIFKVRLLELWKNRIIRFALVGGTGAAIQLTSLHIYRGFIPQVGPLTAFQVATLLSIETAIISNFILNNFFTFSDRSLALLQVPAKFVQFNLASMGSVFIQFLLSSGGEYFIGLFTLLTLPFGASIDTGFVYAVAGILLGMGWNFFAYSRLVWKQK
jgi:dolichol-phosphate mannosyltransferase